MISSIGERIGELMTEKSLTNEQIARTLGVSFPAVSQWKNERCDISIGNLYKLANLFECSIDYLVGRAEFDAGFSKMETTFFLRLQELLSLNKISLYRLDKNKVMTKSTYYSWLKGTVPRLSNIVPIADYFDCSIDYLLGC